MEFPIKSPISHRFFRIVMGYSEYSRRSKHMFETTNHEPCLPTSPKNMIILGCTEGDETIAWIRAAQMPKAQHPWNSAWKHMENTQKANLQLEYQNISEYIMTISWIYHEYIMNISWIYHNIIFQTQWCVEVPWQSWHLSQAIGNSGLVLAIGHGHRMPYHGRLDDKYCCKIRDHLFHLFSGFSTLVDWLVVSVLSVPAHSSPSRHSSLSVENHYNHSIDWIE